MKIRQQPRAPIERTFSRPRNYTFAVVMPRFEDMFHSHYALELIKGVGSSISRLKLDMFLHLIDETSRDAVFTKKIFRPEYFDGVLFADIYQGEKILQETKRKKVPYIVMNHYYQEKYYAQMNEPACNALSVDYVMAGKRT